MIGANLDVCLLLNGEAWLTLCRSRAARSKILERSHADGNVIDVELVHGRSWCVCSIQ